MVMATLPRLNAGQRALILGRTGSGKTTGAAWLLSRSAGQWVILNSKFDPLLTQCGPSVKWSAPDIQRGLIDNRIVVAHPESYDPEILDSELLALIETRAPVSVMVDELSYTHFANGRAGPGLQGLLTRGRSRGQSFIGCTQRPAAISQFCYSESDAFGVYRITLPQDWSKLIAITGRASIKRVRAPYYWAWYDVTADRLREYGPVPEHDLLRRFRY